MNEKTIKAWLEGPLEDLTESALIECVKYLLAENRRLLNESSPMVAWLMETERLAKEMKSEHD